MQPLLDRPKDAKAAKGVMPSSRRLHGVTIKSSIEIEITAVEERRQQYDRLVTFVCLLCEIAVDSLVSFLHNRSRVSKDRPKRNGRYVIGFAPPHSPYVSPSFFIDWVVAVVCCWTAY